MSRNDFYHISSRRESKPDGVMLRLILMSGKPGKPRFCRFYGSESTAQEVIKRLEELNPGDKYIEA